MADTVRLPVRLLGSYHPLGDATLILPSRDIPQATMDKLNDITARVAKALAITGPFNMQVIWKGDELKVIECNLRASRRCVLRSRAFGEVRSSCC